MITVAELPEFIRHAQKLLSATERSSVIDYLAEHPKAGDVMEGTRSIRKLRWGRGDRGKSGGVRVIYFFQRRNAALSNYPVRQKPTGQFDDGRAQRVGQHG